MTSDWTVEASYENAKNQFEEKGFPMPEKGWIFNSNWMDWNLIKGGLRASVTWDIPGPIDWDIYDSSTDKEDDHPDSKFSGTEPTFQEAVLAAERKLNDVIRKEPTTDSD